MFFLFKLEKRHWKLFIKTAEIIVYNCGKCANIFTTNQLINCVRETIKIKNKLKIF